MYEDQLVAIARNNYFIYGIGSSSIQYFYDAGNAGTSPLENQSPAIQQFGCPAPNTVVQTEKEVILVGQSGNGEFSVWSLDGFKEKDISLNVPTIRAALASEGTNIANASAYCIRVGGQKIYLLNLTSRTLAYSFDTELWSEWCSGSSGNFIGTWGDDGPNGTAWVQSATNGNIYSVSSNAYDDAGSAFTCSIVTPKVDFGTFNRKFCHRLSLIGDVPDPTGVDNTMYVSWTDNDYYTFTSPRALSWNNDFPSLAQLGSFRRRAFKITYNKAHPIRLEGVEFDINKGNQ
jgi:hypothetical protein